jgi:hypothetical protein
MADAIKNLPDEMRLRFECLKLASVHDPNKETWHLVNAAGYLFRYVSSGRTDMDGDEGGTVTSDGVEGKNISES